MGVARAGRPISRATLKTDSPPREPAETQTTEHALRAQRKLYPPRAPSPRTGQSWAAVGFFRRAEKKRWRLVSDGRAGKAVWGSSSQSWCRLQPPAPGSRQAPCPALQGFPGSAPSSSTRPRRGGRYAGRVTSASCRLYSSVCRGARRGSQVWMVTQQLVLAGWGLCDSSRTLPTARRGFPPFARRL